MQDDVYSFSIGGYVTKDLHLYGKIVTNVVTKSGSFDFKLSSSSEGGLKISSILKTLKGIPIIDDIGFRSIDLTLHREKGKTDSGDINAEALLWGVPVTFLCSFSGEKIHISIGTSPTFKGGFALAEQWTILKSIPVIFFHSSFFALYQKRVLFSTIVQNEYFLEHVHLLVLDFVLIM